VRKKASASKKSAQKINMRPRWRAKTSAQKDGGSRAAGALLPGKTMMPASGGILDMKPE
jgi:hypothetical protein